MIGDRYISTEESKIIVAMGFDVDDWKGKKILEKIPGTTRTEWCEEECIMKEVTDAIILPHLRIDQAAKWLREEWGIDIVISPRFNSNTGDRIGYFWRWSQRTDVNMRPKNHKSYESAMSNAISTVLNQFKPITKGGEQ